MKKSIAHIGFSSILLIVAAVAVVGQNFTVREIMAEPSIAGQRVSGEKVSPDGKHIIYLWNAEGKPRRDLYIASTSDGSSQILLKFGDLPRRERPERPESKLNYGLILRDEFVKDREEQLGNFEWSPDSTRLLFTHSGDLFTMTLADKKIRRFTQTQAPEFGARFLDNDRILYSQSGHLFVLDTVNATTIQLSRESTPTAFLSVFGGTPSKNGAMIAYTVSDSSDHRALVVPNYLPEFVSPQPTRRGWTTQKVMVTPTDGSAERSSEIKLPKPEGVSNIRRLIWASDNKSLLIDRVDQDTKRRQLFYVFNAGAKDEKIISVVEETDDKWQASLSSIIEANPSDPTELFFGSEVSGFNHLNIAKVNVETAKVEINQITRGNWQVEWAKWSPEGRDILYVSTVDDPAERTFNLYSKPLKGSLPVDVGLKGMLDGFQASDTQYPTILFEYSRWNMPGELYFVKGCEGCSTPLKPVKVTRTVPENFGKIKWTEPKFIQIDSRDGKRIPAKIYLPAGHKPNSKTKYPMVIFVHGAGYLQNVINGWNNYYREFMFNDMLAKKGYVVLDIDYRGSAGYGRDWRTDVYDFLGGKDFDDHIDSIDHMVKNYGVDQSKIGVYGGSYGGFMAGMLVMRAPERIAAAAALRPVFDWKNYYAANPGYTAQRLGFPEKNPEAYKRSSPITYADKLERPLLILHGMADDNVHVQDSVQLMEKLIRLGKTKYFESMLYPSENHAFQRPESWADEYERILKLFEDNLK